MGQEYDSSPPCGPRGETTRWGTSACQPSRLPSLLRSGCSSEMYSITFRQTQHTALSQTPCLLGFQSPSPPAPALL